MKKLILATALAATLAVPAWADDYYVVVPVAGKTYSLSAIDVTLSSATLPSGLAGKAYGYFDLKPSLMVTGDPSYDISGVKWSLASGALPPGMSLLGGVISGTPTAGGQFTFEVEVSYKTKTARQTYQLSVASNLTAQGNWFVSTTRAGSGAYAFDFDDATNWVSFYDAGEYIGRNYGATAKYFDRVTVKLSHNRGTALQVLTSGVWTTVYSIPAMTGTVDIPVGRSGTQIRLISTASDNITPMYIYTFNIYGQ